MKNVAVSACVPMVLVAATPADAVKAFASKGIRVEEKELELVEVYVETGFLSQEKTKRYNAICWQSDNEILLRVDTGALLEQAFLNKKANKVNGTKYVYPIKGTGDIVKFEDGSLYTLTRRIPQTKSEWAYQYLVPGALSGIRENQYKVIVDTTDMKMKRR